MKNSSTKTIAFMAIYLALFFVIQWLAEMIGLFRMPQGGMLELGVLALLLCSYHLGWKPAVAVGLLSVLLMFITGRVYIIQANDGFSPLQIVMQFVMEYPIAFGIYGFASLFPNFGKCYSGVAVTNLIRLAIHTIAGTIYWSTPFAASLTYNAWFMIPTMIVCMIVVPILAERVIPAIDTKR